MAKTAELVAHLSPATSYPGNLVTVSGTGANGQVFLQRRQAHGWHEVTRTLAATDGSFAMTVRAPQRVGPVDFRVVQGQKSSRTVEVRVLKPVFAVAAVPTTTSVQHGAPITVTGSVTPAATGNVQLQRLLGGRWITLASGHLRPDGGYAIATVQDPGPYDLRVVKWFTKTRGRGVSHSFNITVLKAATSPGRPTITTSSLPGAVVGTAYDVLLVATGGTPPYTWSAASLPAGLQLSAGGRLTGTPTQPGTSVVALTVTDAAGRSAVVTLTVIVAPRPKVLESWGANDVGQLGDGVPAFYNPPIKPAALSGIASVASGAHTAYALTTAGAVLAWGNGGNGQLGNGGTGLSRAPVAVTGLEAGVTAIAAGSNDGYALKADGTVWAWGSGSQFKLGNGGTTDALTPTQVSGLTGVTAIAAGQDNGFALLNDGTVWAWGLSNFGALGDGMFDNPSQPVQVSGLPLPVTAIAAGSTNGYALLNDGSVRAWGSNDAGQVGDNTPIDRRAAVAVSGLTGVTGIAALGSGALALKSDGTVVGWGDGGQGALGTGTTNIVLHPITVVGLSGVTSIAASSLASYAVLADGTVRALGYNAHGDLGDGTFAQSASPVTVIGPAGVTTVLAGPSETVFALTPTGVWQWGDEPARFNDRSAPGPVSGVSGVTQVAADGSGGQVLLTDGTVRAWGDNSHGQLGQGSAGGAATTAITVPLPTTPIALAGTRRSMATRFAVEADGTVLAWGDNTYETLGVSGPFVATPQAVPGLTGIVAIAGSSASGYALDSAGHVFAWGDNSRGELGDGTTNGRAAPAVVPGLNNVVALAAANTTAYALDSDGVVWSWGGNDVGQVGDGTHNDSAVPVPVLGLADTVAIAGGNDVGYALESDGTVRDWGGGFNGELGNGASNGTSSAVSVTGLTGVRAIAAGNNNGYALTAAGTVFAWGMDDRGQLGDGNLSGSSDVAVQVAGLSDVTAIAAGGSAYAVH